MIVSYSIIYLIIIKEKVVDHIIKKIEKTSLHI